MMAMFPYAGFGYGLWWIFPLIMIVMIALCFFMMRRRMGSMMCRQGSCRTGSDGGAAESASDTLEKRYVRGEIGKEEYEEKKKVVTGRN
jgi:uncharacterized membrane protein